MTPEEVNLQVALKLLSLPRTLGPHPESGEPIVAYNGRFGPYIKCGEDTRSLPPDLSPLDIELAGALELLAQPKVRSRGRAAARREPLKVLEASPVTGEPVKVLDGRYGPYVTDGQTNASVPKDVAPQELTFEQAVDLLAARAARGGPRRGRKKAASTRGAKKTAGKARTTAGKAARKTTGKTKRKTVGKEPAAAKKAGAKNKAAARKKAAKKSKKG
jgi:DNA topoisomerase-1